MFSLERLRALDAVAVHGTIARAAASLHVTASGVSQQLAKLERESGHRLLEPYGRSVRLTHAGRVLAAHAARVCAQVAEAEADLADMQDEILGPLRLGGVGSSLRALLPGVLTALTASHPRLVPTVVDGEVVELVPGLVGGELDLLLIESWSSRPIRLPQGLAVRTLVVEEVQLAVPDAHPLAGRERVGLAELGELGEADATGAAVWASCPVGTEPYEGLTQALREVGLEPEVRYRVTEYATQLALVRGGLCVALVPEMAQRPCPPGVRFVPVRPVVRRTVQAAWRSLGESPAVRACVAALAEAAQAQAESESGAAGGVRANG
ncbi:LysR family transcriptional regulator [Streptomyces sp. WMMC500]|uniref:LysR family transcriptional regulator n=1 Tax=Streptomyces sp. WMMC500 TaxID=3015154 RepID=UPI00248C8EAA|nr:LysR family transcriptional regulator [Streptomyces sp. WMMC500]WBB57992.1 LysR family transcriptional regulator [Streptomyces sp. WMMC500]